ncbi:WhiB family transcriptional regulator [Streptomyces sp. NPDC056169]|uniref:WhiB family transcriptional regulator n=1 Tax=Streptomyces sp. NPDC056169 TaxID=3345734 RepID=UPI0035DA907B
MSTETRLAITPAASTPSGGWKAPCRVEPDLFFQRSNRAQDEVRAYCRACPELTRCAAAVLKAGGHSSDRWSVMAGLNPAQRVALAWEQRLRGHGPDLEVARMLLRHVWQYRLYPLRSAGLNPDEIAESLRIDGLVTDGLTVRLAVWWLGGKGAWVTWRTRGGRVDRLVAEHADVMTRLRSLRAIHADIAAYLGAELTYVSRAVTSMEQSRAAAEGLEVAA